MGCLASKQSAITDPPPEPDTIISDVDYDASTLAASTPDPSEPEPEPEVGGGSPSGSGSDVHYIVQEGEAGIPLAGAAASAAHPGAIEDGGPTSPTALDITNPDWKPSGRDRGKSGSVFAFASRNAKDRLPSEDSDGAGAALHPSQIDEEDDEDGFADDDANGGLAVPYQDQGRRRSSLIEDIDRSMSLEAPISGMSSIAEDEDETDVAGNAADAAAADDDDKPVLRRPKKIHGPNCGDPRMRLSIAIANELRGKIGLGGAKPRKKKKTVVHPTSSISTESTGDAGSAAPKQSNLSRERLRQTAEPEPQYDIAQNYKMHPENVAAFMNDTDTPQPRATVPLVDDEVGLDDTQHLPHDTVRDSNASVALLATHEVDSLERQWKQEGLAEVVEQLDHRVSVKNPQTKKYSSLQQDEVDGLMRAWEAEGKKEAAIIEDQEAVGAPSPPQSKVTASTMAASSFDVELE